MALLPKPPFPNVPKLPGVPQLLRSPNFPASPGPVLGSAVAAARLLLALIQQPKWGIYKQTPEPTTDADGIPTVVVRGRLEPVITPDNILDFGYRNEYDISDYPVEEGAFMSYNKVGNPYEASVRFSKGGTESQRRDFLKQIEVVVASLDKFYIMTPERTYKDVNAYRFEVTRRGAGGAYFLTEVDLYFREVRTTTAQYTQTGRSIFNPVNAKDPSALLPENTGAIQANLEDATANISGVVGL